ncbi:putative carbonic anhydrase [Rosa chinensis]|uniref:Putative carbonic anhydrase n=1 Tax=Rosa chinensis TaxID=74649 RepID=A0A2P6RB61_ROSCH|nr:putative carbonic anhydrase [Rosa chinensis]
MLYLLFIADVVMVKSKKVHLQFFAFTLFLLSWHPIRPVSGQGVEEIGYDYRQGSPKGPEHWGELKEEWKECKDGKLQSPIDLLDSNARKAISRVDDLNMSYKPSNATMKHEGYAISIQWEGDAGSIQINGTDYLLKRCHWHRSSEHFINGRRFLFLFASLFEKSKILHICLNRVLFISYDLELHMVHQSQNNDVAVVAFLYQSGNPDPFLSKISNDVSSLSGTKEARLGVIDPSLIKWPSSRFYRYMGSLTTPPCTGGVIWSVYEEVHSVSEEQLGLIEQVDVSNIFLLTDLIYTSK